MKRLTAFILAFAVAAASLFVTALAEEGADDTSGVICLDLTEYQNGIVNKLDSAAVDEVLFDGRRTVRLTPNPTCTVTKTLALDGYSYNTAGIDLEQYSAVALEYYYDSQSPINARGLITIQTNGNVLTSGFSVYSKEPVAARKWDCMIFDISGVKKLLNPNTDDHNMRQMHIRPFGTDTLPSLSASEPIYFGKLIFFKEMPDFTYVSSYFEGYEDGTFRPSRLLSRAEGCVLTARLIEDDIKISGTPTFKDVDPEAYYARYVGFLEEKGMLESFGKTFSPENNITQSELSGLLAMAVSLKEDGTLPADPVGELSLDGASSRPVSRGQAAAMINTVTGYTPNRSRVSEELPVLFLDVDEKNPYYADIAATSIDHARLSGEWYFSFQNAIDMLAEKIGYDYFYNTDKGYEKIAELDTLEKTRIAEIRGTYNDPPKHSGRTYYVAADGDDTNSGLSPDTPKRTIAAANALAVSNDAVLMRRGDIFRERITAKANVVYSAYGYGNKPKIYGSPENGAASSKWKLVYENKDTGALIWKYEREDLLDVGTLVLNEGEGYAMKELPSCDGTQFVMRSDKSVPYDYEKELDKNMEFFHAANSATLSTAASGVFIDASRATGPLYFRCDNGNPGKVFSSIEFNTKGNVISAASGVTIDNLCIMYGGSHGIGTGSVTDLTVTNCEIGWIGGSIQSYNANGTTNNDATRFGNGVEVYGSCDGYTIDNCYVYQCYDAGVTHQFSSLTSGNCTMDNVTYSNNLITDCVYSIEYFLGTVEGYTRGGNNILFEGNIMRRAGYGFGSFRPDGNNQRHIRSSSRDNPFTDYRIINNVFDRSVHQLIYANTPFDECVPEMEGNIYIQGIGNHLYHVGLSQSASDYYAIDRIKKVLGDKTGEIYFVDKIPYYKYDYTPSRTVAVTDKDREG